MKTFKLSSSFKEWGAFFIIAFLGFGTGFYCIKIALRELAPIEFTTYRLTIASICLWLLIIIYKISVPFDTKTIFKMSFCGILGGCIPFMLVSWAELYIGSGIAGVLNSLVPIFTIILSAIFLSHKDLNAKLIFGVILGFIGVLFIFSDKLASLDGNAHILLPELAMVGASLCYAAQSIYVKSYLKKEHFILIAGMSTSIAAIVMWIVLLTAKPDMVVPKQSSTILAILWMAVVSTCLSQILLYYLIKRWSPTRASFIAYLVPIVAMMLGKFALDESLTLNMLIGSGAIIISIALSNNKNNKVKAPDK